MTIVWIASRFTDEHRAALDWLNAVTSEDISFFGLEIELWRIENSPMAPKFNVVCKPNDWTKDSLSIRPSELGDSKQLQLEFWTGFREYASETAKCIKTTKPLPQHWMNIALGRSGCRLVAVASTYDSEKATRDNGELRAELSLDDNRAKTHFVLLKAMKDDLENMLGEPLIWYNPADKKTCRLYYRHPAAP